MGREEVQQYFGDGTSEYLSDSLFERSRKRNRDGCSEIGGIWLQDERRGKRKCRTFGEVAGVYRCDIGQVTHCTGTIINKAFALLGRRVLTAPVA